MLNSTAFLIGRRVSAAAAKNGDAATDERKRRRVDRITSRFYIKRKCRAVCSTGSRAFVAQAFLPARMDRG
jgi:hypothetical protein